MFRISEQVNITQPKQIIRLVQQCFLLFYLYHRYEVGIILEHKFYITSKYISKYLILNTI